MHGPEPEDLPKVTLAHLRAAESMCRRRLHHEHHDRGGNRGSSARWRVMSRVRAAARLTHVDLAEPDRAQFRGDPELTDEERRLLDVAADWYVALYAGRPVRSVDIDEWSTGLPAAGVRLVGPVGLPVVGPGDAREIRVLRLGDAPADDPLSLPEIRFSLLRLESWTASSLVLVSVADLLSGELRETTVDVAAVTPELHAWLEARLEVIRERVADPRARAGLECSRCAFVAGCPALRQ